MLHTLHTSTKTPGGYALRCNWTAARQSFDVASYQVAGHAAQRQVFLSYGPLPNLRALLFYGFVLRDNPHDTLALTFEARTASTGE